MEDLQSSPPRSESKAQLRHILSEPSPPPVVQGATPKAEESTLDLPPAAPVSTSKAPRKKLAEREGFAFGANKMKFLKKEDGEPFSRADIQYSFLNHIFSDDKRVFTKYSDRTPGCTFAEIYIDAMAKSSKCSNLLKEKLLSEIEDPSVIPAKDMAMVCLLVNVGRMNTTVNFFPEMRARVRTFHSIPSLQAKQGPSAYKQLQDGPRLKSILKGCQEDHPQPITITELVATFKPRINPVSLVFLLAQFAPKVTDNHFQAGFDFFELFVRDTLSSASRARTFLWLCWWYLESDFTADDCLNNPYGAGQPGSEPKNDARVPDPEVISEAEAKAENEDPDYEVEFGLQKKKEREEILASGDPPSASGKRAVKGMNPDIDIPANLPLETSTETPFFDQTPSDQPRAEYLDPTPFDSQNHQTPVLAPAPSAGFTAANKAPSSANQYRKRSRSASPAQPRSLKLPKLRPNLSQQSGESVSSNRTPAEQYLQPAPAMQHQGYTQGVSPYGIHPPQATEDGPEEYSPYRETEAPPAQPTYPPSTHTPFAIPSHPQYYQQQPYPLAGSPYGSGYPYQPTPAVQAPDVEVVPPPHPTPMYNTRSRNAHQTQPQSAEHSRLEKVGNLVDSNMAALRRAKLNERRKRGVVTDAWIKARSLPGGWDSEEDEFDRVGGLDEVRDQEGGGLAVNISVGPGSNETKRWHIGDAGTQAHELAFACSKLSVTLKRLSQRRMKPKSSKKRKVPDERDFDGAEGTDGRRVSRRTSAFPAPPESSQLHYGHPASYLSPASRPHHHHSHEPRPHHHHIVNRPHHHHPPQNPSQPHTHETATSSFPRPPTPPDRGFRRPSYTQQQSFNQSHLRGGQSDAPLSPQDQEPPSATATADKTFNWTPKGRKRKDSDTHTLGTRPGEIGVPLGKFVDVEGARVVDPSAVSMQGAGRRRGSTLGSARSIDDGGAGRGNEQQRREAEDVEMEG